MQTVIIFNKRNKKSTDRGKPSTPIKKITPKKSRTQEKTTDFKIEKRSNKLVKRQILWYKPVKINIPI